MKKYVLLPVVLLFCTAAASFAIPLRGAVVTGSYFVNQGGTLASTKVNNGAYLSAAAQLSLIPKKELIVAIDEATGTVGVFRRSNGAQVFGIVVPTGTFGSAANGANTKIAATSSITVATPNSILMNGSAFSRANFTGSGDLKFQTTQFNCGAGGIAMKGSVTTTGVRLFD